MTTKLLIDGDCRLSDAVDGESSLTTVADGEVGVFMGLIPDPYTGEYVFTPTEETQIVPTVGLTMIDNITVNPIPSNYGRITWDGSVITVS